MAGRTGWLLSDGPNPRDAITIPDAQWGWPIYLQNCVVVLGVYVLHLGSFGGKCR